MDLALREKSLEATILANKLAALKRERSAKPTDERQIEADVAERQLQYPEGILATAETDRRKRPRNHTEIDIANAEANLDLARADLEAALVRSPLDGVVVQIFARRGENVPPTGIAKIVDMQQLRVLADVDEQRVGSLKPGGKAEVTFRGEATVHKGKISSIAPALKRMRQADPNTSSSTDARVVQVEVDPSTIRQACPMCLAAKPWHHVPASIRDQNSGFRHQCQRPVAVFDAQPIGTPPAWLSTTHILSRRFENRTSCCMRGISHDALSGTESQRSGDNGWSDQRLA